MIKKYLLIVIVAFTLLAGLQASAQPIANPNSEMNRQLQAAGGPQGGNLGVPVDPRLIVANIIYVALGIIGIIFVVLLVYAGFLWMTAGGNEDNIKTAKSIIFASIIGLLIILCAYSITWFVFKVALGIPDDVQYIDYY